MKIAGVYYSRTGHTRSILGEISRRINQSGHRMDCYALPLPTVAGLTSGSTSLFDLVIYDCLILGSPVNGGHPSVPMQAFLKQTPDLTGVCFSLVVTHFFRRGWGTIQTLQTLRSICTTKGGIFLAEMDVKWFSVFRKWNTRIALDKFMDEMSGLLKYS